MRVRRGGAQPALEGPSMIYSSGCYPLHAFPLPPRFIFSLVTPPFRLTHGRSINIHRSSRVPWQGYEHVYPDDRVKYVFPLSHHTTSRYALFTTIPQPCGHVVHPALLIPDEPSLVELCKMWDVLAAVCGSCPSVCPSTLPSMTQVSVCLVTCAS